MPHFVKLYDDLGPESDQYATSLAAVAKTRYGRWYCVSLVPQNQTNTDSIAAQAAVRLALADRRAWLALHWLPESQLALLSTALVGLCGFFFCLAALLTSVCCYRVVPALGAPWFGPAIFVREVLQASHWRYPTAYAHSIIAALSLVIQFLPVSWLTAITKFTCLLFCLGLGVTLVRCFLFCVYQRASSMLTCASTQKDDRDIPLVLFIASFFYDFTGKQHNTFLNRLLGAHALLAYIVSLLPLAVLLGSPRYPVRRV